MKIIQLSDIHLGGDYGGKFDTAKNLKSTIDYICKHESDVDMVVLTGDLCENNNEEEYMDLNMYLSKLKQSFPDIEIGAVGGNHDNFFKMKEYESTYNVFEGFTDDYGINALFLNAENAMLSDFQLNMIRKYEPTNIFIHYPVGDIPNEFMNCEAHNLKNADAFMNVLKELPSVNVFCGHYHNTGCYEFGSISVYVAPSLQCQLDNTTKDCVVTSKIPAYSVIEFDTSYNNNVKSYTVKQVNDE